MKTMQEALIPNSRAFPDTQPAAGGRSARLDS